MADILIRGISIPRNCFECPLFTNCDACEGHECGCGLLGGIGYEEDISDYRRRDDCPLVELPKHGDLIDLSELQKFPIRLDHYDKEHGDEHFVYGIESLMEYAEYLPVVVQAERSGE